MQYFVFLTCPSNLYLCMESMISPVDGFNYYACVLIYADDVMVVHPDA